MAIVWHGSTPEGGRGSHGSANEIRRRHIKWWIVTLVPVVLVLAGSYAGLRLWDNFTQSLDKSFSGFGRGLEKSLQAIQSGGTAANAAAFVAAPQPPGSLSVSALNAALPKYQWVDGATNVPYSSKRPIGLDPVRRTGLLC